MSTFFSTKLVESMVPENAIMHKQSLTQDQAMVFIKEGVVPCSEQAHQILEKITSSLGIAISKSTRIPDELSIGDKFLLLITQPEHGDECKASSKFVLWTRLA